VPTGWSSPTFLLCRLDYSIDKAKRILGYRPDIDFREGIQAALKWAQREGLIPVTP